mmetsp:Transcript_53445/g.116506  ORF Transcript_53445/g.116506 Transcript_53445/m.116506 type:complete len:232 (-) Transcript_53445:1133-1828(-)
MGSALSSKGRCRSQHATLIVACKAAQQRATQLQSDHSRSLCSCALRLEHACARAERDAHAHTCGLARAHAAVDVFYTSLLCDHRAHAGKDGTSRQYPPLLGRHSLPLARGRDNRIRHSSEPLPQPRQRTDRHGNGIVISAIADARSAIASLERRPRIRSVCECDFVSEEVFEAGERQQDEVEGERHAEPAQDLRREAQCEEAVADDLIHEGLVSVHRTLQHLWHPRRHHGH